MQAMNNIGRLVPKFLNQRLRCLRDRYDCKGQGDLTNEWVQLSANQILFTYLHLAADAR